MCDSCGCGITAHAAQHAAAAPGADGKATVAVLQGLLAENDHQAAHNRAHFDDHGVLAVNLMSAPGAGKTCLLEATVRALKDELAIAVVEGDLETENDAERIRAHGVPAVQIATGGACHLDARMVHEALHRLALDGLDILFIENVGNLVCPASFDLGQHRNVTLLSVTEGDDKPAKYPVMFRVADLVLLSKLDLLPVLDDFDPANAARHLQALGRQVPLLQLSARRGPGLEAWLAWLRAELASHRGRLAAGAQAGHRHSAAAARPHAAPTRHSAGGR